MNENFNIGIYEWIQGKKILYPKNSDLEECTKFIKKLHTISKKINFKKINLASEACLSANDLIRQVEKRLINLKKVKKNNLKLHIFLDRTFSPLWEEVKKNCFKRWPKDSQHKSISYKKLILSPSDFGFHNAIKNNKKLIFIDFEYFGWDDPVKLTADFLWHPSINLNNDLIDKWKKEMLSIFNDDKSFENRFGCFYASLWNEMDYNNT